MGVQTSYFRPLIPLSMVLSAGIFVGVKLPGYTFLAGAVTVSGIAWLAFLIKKERLSRFSPLLLMAAAGYISIQPWTAPTFPLNHIIHYTKANARHLEGVVITHPVHTNGRIKFHMKVIRLEEGGRMTRVQGKIRVTAMGKVAISKGDRIRFPGKIRTIRNFNNPGGFDYERYMAFQGIFVSTFVKADRIIVTGKQEIFWWSSHIDRSRALISRFMDEQLPSTPETMAQKAVLKALVIGDKSLITHELRDSFNRAGVSHLLAISGLHVGIVAAFSFAVFTWMLSFIKPLLWQGWTTRWAAVIALIPVVFYGFLAGMPPSTQRAVIMVAVFLMAFPFQKDPDPMNTLAVAAILILAVHPPSLFSISFQLSFSAVIAILYGLSFRPDQEHEKRQGYLKWVNRVKTFILVSVFAFLGTLPLVMFYFNQVPLLGICANLVAVPIIGFGAVPAGLLSAFILPFSAIASGWLLALSAALIKGALVLIHLISDLSLSAVKTVTPSGFEICLFYLSCWILFNCYKKKGLIYWVFALALLWGGDGIYWLNQRYWHQDLKVTAIDVGQGGAALIEAPGGFVALYDGGGFYDNSIFDVGERIVAPFLWRKKIAAVDLLILSHPNSDHLNGLIYIARHFKVKQFWSNNESSNTKGFQELMRTLDEKGTPVSDFRSMNRTLNVGQTGFHVLYPSPDFLYKPLSKTRPDTNNNSLVMKVTLGKTAFLFTGDVLARGERELLRTKGDHLESTVMFIPHHGSATSSTRAFLRQVKPEVAVASAGYMNRFGFPKPEVVKRYTDEDIRVMCTCLQGAICFSSDGALVRAAPCMKEMAAER